MPEPLESTIQDRERLVAAETTLKAIVLTLKEIKADTAQVPLIAQRMAQMEAENKTLATDVATLKTKNTEAQATVRVLKWIAGGGLGLSATGVMAWVLEILRTASEG
jgi:hypothetical protein